jgi:hypothetical protein
VNALLKSLPDMGNVSLVALFWLGMYALLGVQLFKGKFYKCYDYSTQVSCLNNRPRCRGYVEVTECNRFPYTFPCKACWDLSYQAVTLQNLPPPALPSCDGVAYDIVFALVEDWFGPACLLP